MNPGDSLITTTASYNLVTEPDQGLGTIYNLLSSATKSIDMTMYELTDATAVSMLIKAATDGVSVRVILDQNSEKTINTPVYDQLASSKVQVHWANPAYFVTHQKTITVDQATSAIMTLNLDTEDYPTSRDFAVMTNNAADIAAIVTTFNADFENASIVPPTGENLVWSPTNARSSLQALIEGAAHTLLLSQEEFSDPGMAMALEAALKRGVTVTLVQENINGEYTSALDPLKKAGAQIAVYTSETGRYIHAKTVLADFGTAQAKLFVGSQNFSADSLGKNRELGLIFSDPVCMAGVQATISADYKAGTIF